VSSLRLSWFGQSYRRLALAVVSILLVLHSAAPAFQSLPLPGGAAPEPGYSSAQLTAYQGTLPRLLTRAPSLEAGDAKSEHSVWPAAEDATASRPASPPAAVAPRAGRPAMPSGRHAAGSSAAFEPRGPPLRIS
jgi:hypothetical protein